MIFVCDKHGNGPSIKIGNGLKEMALNGERLSHLVAIIYEGFPGDKNSRIRFTFSPEEADKYNIPFPGVIIRFNLDLDYDPEDPFEEATKNTSVMCYECFKDLYREQLDELEKRCDDFKDLYLE
jgi:hypothetical protein